ncbi:MAG: aminotransferase class V-fold PLP-dependent enzyme [Chloroflexota bacterium]|nr:aminotransferase class V-fold PLP-dependent enzyme [Chloroflexota bacterium]
MFDPLALKTQFLLRPDVTFLNHGSFGACPKPVFDTYQQWQLELERQPVEFLGRRYDDLLDEARAALARYLNAAADSLIFVPNATTGINVVARSLALAAGDEILTSDQEYGAMDYTWQFVCEKTGARYIRQPLVLDETLADAFWSQVTPRTKVIFLSHITSATATILPIAELCRRARAHGILTIIDGAHAPGQIPLDLTALDADAYTGNCHKWLCAPKGSAFLMVQPHLHALIEPAVISWGWLPGASFAKRNQWQGTRDIAAYLSVPAAIQFQHEHEWDAVRAHGHALARQTRQRAADLTGVAPLVPDSPDWYAQMITLPLPGRDTERLTRRLREAYQIEIPFTKWNDQTGIRASFQGYNTQADADLLLEGLGVLLGGV